MTQDAADRSKRVLAALVREYIASGEPVASSLLVTAAGLGVSSATVRNILARLEEEGFVQQPHTSAGRIPTDRGYRFYVDLLLESKRAEPDGDRGRSAAAPRQPRPACSTRCCRRCRTCCRRRRAASASRCGRRTKRRCSTASSSCRSAALRVLVVIVASGGHVIQKVIELGEPLGADDLRQAANYLNVEFSGLPLHRAREAVLERINEERSLYDALRARAMRLATSTFSDLPDDRPMYVEGAASLLDDATGLTVQTLQALLQMIEEKQKLLELLNEYIDGPGLTVVIGAEHLDPNLRPFSLVLSTYDDGAGIGTVGVIGPTRMHYSRAIAVVDGAAQAVSRVLRDPN